MSIQQTRPIKHQVVSETEKTLRMLVKNENMSPELQDCYKLVIGHLKHTMGHKYNGK
ncbi:hypothetical protein ACFTQL_14015 [Peribacillus butanolivorans]|uniref:hypothetical protein n=1 Tax=Peribacillus butanolivorans TaxID=421767 RepID=UPI000A4C124B|nr:hypothetical protein [Peribacillus butanolivorans]MCO0600387.1 hypothetical protein [Peribacillus butanolivorans]QNU04818.1 hypothetical protein GM240_13305 [Peribacillus butanolivorans]